MPAHASLVPFQEAHLLLHILESLILSHQFHTHQHAFHTRKSRRCRGRSAFLLRVLCARHSRDRHAKLQILGSRYVPSRLLTCGARIHTSRAACTRNSVWCHHGVSSRERVRRKLRRGKHPSVNRGRDVSVFVFRPAAAAADFRTLTQE
jgi:hypothetical protein